MFCRKCGNKLDDKVVMCPKCGTLMQPKPIREEYGLGIRMILPVGRSGWAIAAGYAGLLSILPGVGLLAIIFGILALKDIKAHPQKHGRGRANFGIVSGLIGSLFSSLFILLPLLLRGL